MKRIIPFIFILLSACKPELPEIPGDVIGMEEMVQILTDIHIADAVAETNAQKGENEKRLTIQYTEQIYKNHKTTKSDFIRSIRFYETNPVLLNKIYDKVLVELSKREEKAGNKQKDKL